MSFSEKSPNLIVRSISEVSTGMVVVNLGEILEIQEQEKCYMLVIWRMNEKQVMKFEKGTFLIILSIAV